MKAGKRFLFTSLTSLFLLVMMVGCQSESDAPTTTPTPVPSHTAAPPTLTVTPLPTATETAIPPTPTFTPLPTLSPEEAQVKVLELLETNGDCDLPCWWGIRPGVTRIEDARRFLNTLGGIEHFSLEYSILDIGFQVPEDIYISTYLSQLYIFEGSIVDIIQTRTGNVPSYTLSNLVARLGQPTEVRIGIWYPGYEDNFTFSIYLFYHEIGVIAIYTSQSIVTNEYVYGCPNNVSNPYLILWMPSDMMFFERIEAPVLLGKPDGDLYTLYPLIEEISELDTSEFYKIYSDPDSNYCFQTPRDVWPDILTGVGH